MTDPTPIIQAAYAAFGSGDIPRLLGMMRDDVRWQFVGDRSAPYTATVVGKAQLAEWFGAVAAADDIQAFEPRRFLAGSDHVTVLGWERSVARSSGRSFESDWVHLWTLQDGLISGFWGMLDTQAAAGAP